MGFHIIYNQRNFEMIQDDNLLLTQVMTNTFYKAIIFAKISCIIEKFKAIIYDTFTSLAIRGCNMLLQSISYYTKKGKKHLIAIMTAVSTAYTVYALIFLIAIIQRILPFIGSIFSSFLFLSVNALNDFSASFFNLILHLLPCYKMQ